FDLAVVDVEPVREQQCAARTQVARDLVAVHRGLDRVRDEERDDVGCGDGVGDGTHVEAGRARGGGGAAVRAQADRGGDAAVVQVERVGVTLTAVADDGDAAAGEHAAVRVRGLEDPDGAHSGLPPVSVCGSTGTTAA